MKPAQWAQLLVVALAAVAVYGFVSAARNGEERRLCTPICALEPSYAAENRLAPDFELPTLDGGKVRLAQHRGKVVILNFWTRACRPCLEEMPSLDELAQLAARRKDVVVLTISTDESVQDAKDTLASVLSKPPSFVTLHDPEASVVTGAYGTKLYPETWFIDGRGVIRARFDGARNWASPLAMELVDALLEPLSCGVAFTHGRATGPRAGICDDIAG